MYVAMTADGKIMSWHNCQPSLEETRDGQLKCAGKDDGTDLHFPGIISNLNKLSKLPQIA